MPQLGHDLINYQCLNSDTSINASNWTRSHKLSMPQLRHDLKTVQSLNSDTIYEECPISIYLSRSDFDAFLVR